MSILIVAPSSVGLGHTSFCIALAEQIRAKAPQMPIVLASEVTDARLLELYPFPYYLLPPSDALIHDPRWQDGSINAAGWEVHQAAFRHILAAHRPTLIIWDTFAPEWLHKIALEFNVPQVLMLYRSAALTKHLSTLNAIIKEMRLLIFPYIEQDIDEPDLEWVVDTSKVVYAGPIMRQMGGVAQVNAVKAKYGIDDQRFTIVIANGGGTSIISNYDRYFELVLRALKQIDIQMPPFQVILNTGPLHSHPVPWIEFDKGTLDVRDFEPHLRALYAAANLTITRSGYNTRLELAAVGVPAICIPLRASHDDQSTNLEQLARQAPNLMPHRLDVDAIANTIRRIAHEPHWVYKGGAQPPTTFAEQVVPRLLALAGDG